LIGERFTAVERVGERGMHYSLAYRE